MSLALQLFSPEPSENGINNSSRPDLFTWATIIFKAESLADLRTRMTGLVYSVCPKTTGPMRSICTSIFCQRHTTIRRAQTKTIHSIYDNAPRKLKCSNRKPWNVQQNKRVSLGLFTPYRQLKYAYHAFSISLLLPVRSSSLQRTPTLL